MEVYCAGYHQTQPAGFESNRPQGSGAYLLLVIKTKSFYYEDGVKHIAEPDSVVLYTPEHPYHYGAADAQYADDWIQFSMTDSDLSLIQALGIPMNRVQQISSGTVLSELIHKIAFELDTDNLYRHDIVLLSMQMLFFRMSQFLYHRAEVTEVPLSHYPQLVQLRNELAHHPEREITIDDLAKSVFMSKSHFQHTYKKLFGTSVLEDCSRFRMKNASFYLSSTEMTVKEIAQQCGYTSVFCFIRSFKKHFSMTPTEYRQTFTKPHVSATKAAI